MNAPKLCPAEPLKWIWMVSSGRPCRAVLARDFAAVMVPTTRLTLRIGSSARHFLAALDRRLAKVEQRRDVERLVDAVILRRSGRSGRLSGPTSGWYRMLLKVEALGLPMVDGFAAASSTIDAADHFLDACGSRAAP